MYFGDSLFDLLPPIRKRVIGNIHLKTEVFGYLYYYTKTDILNIKNKIFVVADDCFFSRCCCCCILLLLLLQLCSQAGNSRSKHLSLFFPFPFLLSGISGLSFNSPLLSPLVILPRTALLLLFPLVPLSGLSSFKPQLKTHFFFFFFLVSYS